MMQVSQFQDGQCFGRHPVPKSLLMTRKKEALLAPLRDLLAGMKTSDQDLKSDNSDEASTSHSNEHEPQEELENISNGGSTVVLGYNEQHNEQFHNHDSEENELEWSDSQSDTDLSTDSSDASSSESESF